MLATSESKTVPLESGAAPSSPSRTRTYHYARLGAGEDAAGSAAAATGCAPAISAGFGGLGVCRSCRPLPGGAVPARRTALTASRRERNCGTLLARGW
jgi:hypothetical protein